MTTMETGGAGGAEIAGAMESGEDKAPKQRWARVPSDTATAGWTLRVLPAAWSRDDAWRLERQFSTQGPAAWSWVEARAAAYGAANATLEDGRGAFEARVDLLCWQRQEADPVKALKWFRFVDEGCDECLRTGPRDAGRETGAAGRQGGAGRPGVRSGVGKKL